MKLYAQNQRRLSPPRLYLLELTELVVLAPFALRINLKALLTAELTQVLQGSCGTGCIIAENQLLVHAVCVQLDDGNSRIVAVQLLAIAPFLDVGFIVETLLVVVDGLQVVGVQNTGVRIHHS